MNQLRIFVAILLLACRVATTSAAPTITPIGIINQDPSVSSKAEAINADGTVIVGSNLISAGVNHAIRWSVTGGLQDLSCGVNSGLYSISANGASAVGVINNGSIFLSGRWDSPGCLFQMSQPITSLGARTVGMNPAGTIVVGSTDLFSTFGPYSVPYKWTQSGGVAFLPFPSGHNSGFANAVSSDGQVIVGGTGSVGILAYPQAAYWNSAGAQAMGTMPAGISSTACAASSNGAVIVGYGDNGGAAFFSPGPYRAFRWSGGVYQNLGTLAGAPATGTSYARAVSEDGTVVVGESSTATSSSAFIWRQDFGMMNLSTLLGWLGVNLTGWSNLAECHGISADATALCGTGIYNGVSQGFVVRGLPRLCGPLLVAQSNDTAQCTGTSYTMYVSAFCPPSTTYQWYQQFGVYPLYYILPLSDGIGYSGTHTSVLSFGSVQSENAGQYLCIISGGCASVSSSVVTMSVLSAPVVTLNPPLNLNPCGKGPVTLTIAGSSDAGPISYQWQAEVPFMSNNFVNLIPTVNLNIATAANVYSPSLTLSDFYLGGATTYRCRLTNSCGVSYAQSTLVMPCFGDFNCDGQVDFNDYLDFVDSYSMTGPDADFNHDGFIDFNDYLDFVDSYSVGC